MSYLVRKYLPLHVNQKAPSPLPQDLESGIERWVRGNKMGKKDLSARLQSSRAFYFRSCPASSVCIIYSTNRRGAPYCSY